MLLCRRFLWTWVTACRSFCCSALEILWKTRFPYRPLSPAAQKLAKASLPFWSKTTPTRTTVFDGDPPPLSGTTTLPPPKGQQLTRFEQQPTAPRAPRRGGGFSSPFCSRLRRRRCHPFRSRCDRLLLLLLPTASRFLSFSNPRCAALPVLCHLSFPVMMGPFVVVFDVDFVFCSETPCKNELSIEFFLFIFDMCNDGNNPNCPFVVPICLRSAEAAKLFFPPACGAAARFGLLLRQLLGTHCLLQSVRHFNRLEAAV